MIRSNRCRCFILRYVIFSVFAMTMLKLTSMYYNDFQHRAIDSSSSSLPFDLKTNVDSTFFGFNDTHTFNNSSSINRTENESYRQYVQRMNDEQNLINRHLFSTTTTRYILLVQVHKRVVYLRKFIEMLRAVENIHETLLIFSHDFIDSDINALVTNITFVPVRIVKD